jgi:putative transposase
MKQMTYQYRLQVKDKREKTLSGILEKCRLVYNKVLDTRKTAWETEKKSMTLFDCNNLIKTWEFEGVHSQVLQDVSARVDKAFKGFFRRVKTKGEKAGYPRFKGYGRYDSITYPQTGFKVGGNKLKLSKVGSVKIIKHREMEGKIKTCTVKRNGLGQWFVCFSCEVEDVKVVDSNQKAIGIDVGCKDFAVCSNGESIEHPHFYKQSESKLKAIQSKYSELKQLPKDNKKKLKVKRQLIKQHLKVKNQRKDFLHKVSHKIVKENGIICVEKLNIKKMTSDKWKSMNKSILDSGWYNFKQMLTYKAEWAGKRVVEVNPAYTSQVCSKCGAIVKKELDEREHNCPHCGLLCNRDLNASLNILRVGMDSLSNRKVTLEAHYL